jgi:hypothetical protein
MSTPPRRIVRVPTIAQTNGNASAVVPPTGYLSPLPSSTSDLPPSPPSDASEYPPTFLDETHENLKALPNLADREAFEQWLSQRLPSWSHILTLRVALRVLPFLCNHTVRSAG